MSLVCCSGNGRLGARPPPSFLVALVFPRVTAEHLADERIRVRSYVLATSVVHVVLRFGAVGFRRRQHDRSGADEQNESSGCLREHSRLLFDGAHTLLCVHSHLGPLIAWRQSAGCPATSGGVLRRRAKKAVK